MATATRTIDPPKRTRARTGAPQLGTLDYLQRALEDLDRAREHAQQDAQAGIDDATGRIRAAVEDVRRRVRDEADELQTRLDRLTDEARLELGRAAIRSQRTPKALSELAREIRRVKKALQDEAA